jgi:hypothetical protein
MISAEKEVLDYLFAETGKWLVNSISIFANSQVLAACPGIMGQMVR